MRMFGIAAVLACAGASLQAVDDSSPAPTNVRGAEFPRVDSDYRVTLQLKAPNAKSVQLQPSAGATTPDRFGFEHSEDTRHRVASAMERQSSNAGVVLSSSRNPAERDFCLASGAREFVSKPVELEEFQDAVAGIIERWASKEVSVRGSVAACVNKRRSRVMRVMRS